MCLVKKTDWQTPFPERREEERFKRQIPRMDICLASGNVEGQPPPDKKEDQEKEPEQLANHYGKHA